MLEYDYDSLFAANLATKVTEAELTGTLLVKIGEVDSYAHLVQRR